MLPEEGATINDTDPTVPYQVQEDTDDEKEEEEEGGRTLVMDYEPTVVYNLGKCTICLGIMGILL